MSEANGIVCRAGYLVIPGMRVALPAASPLRMGALA